MGVFCEGCQKETNVACEEGCIGGGGVKKIALRTNAKRDILLHERSKRDGIDST